MLKRFVPGVALIFATTTITALAQNSNSSPTVRPRTTTTQTNTNRSGAALDSSSPQTTAAPKPTPRPTPKAATTPETPGSQSVIAAFNALLDGIRKADVDAVASVYWNSPRLILFNNNGSVTRGWEQMRRNRETSYKDVKDVKLTTRDVAITMLGRDGALVTCLWTQSQTFRGTPETAT